MSQLLRDAPEVLARALEVVAQSLANFARRCLAAGADGIFLAVRDDWVDSPENGPETYRRLVEPGDLAILAAAGAGTFNMLHVCGRPLDFRRFAGYPVQVINWADRYAGPSIAEVADWVQPALCAGLDNLQNHGCRLARRLCAAGDRCDGSGERSSDHDCPRLHL